MRGPSGRELRIALAAWAAVFALQSWYYAVGGTAGAAAFPPAITHPVLAREPAAVALMWLAGMAKLGIGILGFAITSSTAARPHRRALAGSPPLLWPATRGWPASSSGRQQRGRRPVVVRMTRPAATLALAGRAER